MSYHWPDRWWTHSWPDPSMRMPFDFYPCSNGEFIPPPPTADQHEIMRLQEEEGERVRRRLGMSRRDFVRSAAALSVGFWAMKQVGLRRANASHADDPKGCTEEDLHHPGAQLNNLPGEFIVDVQTHHVEEDGLWRVTNPGFAAFFMAVWPQTRCGELDSMECLGRYHYIKEVYLDSSTNVGILSAVPSSPDRNPLPTHVAAETCQTVNGLADSERSILHHFVMPNRGFSTVMGNLDRHAFYLEEELALMTEMKETYPDLLRAWKCYTPWGDIPNASGWMHDDRNGRAMLEHSIELGVNVLCTHKGFALPSFDQRSAACRDIGVVAPEYYDPVDDSKTMKFLVYHSGYDLGQTQRAYAGDDEADSSEVGVDGLIKALRENGWSARNFATGGQPYVPFADGDPTEHANNPNVYAELGSVWREVMRRTSPASGVQAAHVLGKLIYYVGPRRVIWGTDSLWYGSPQPEIARMRTFPEDWEEEAWDVLREEYHLPHGLDGDVDAPSVNAIQAGNPHRTIRNAIFGRNVLGAYGLDPEAKLNEIDCDDLQSLRDEGYLQNPGDFLEVRPASSNVLYGARTRRELFESIWPNGPWAP